MDGGSQRRARTLRRLKTVVECVDYRENRKGKKRNIITVGMAHIKAIPHATIAGFSSSSHFLGSLPHSVRPGRAVPLQGYNGLAMKGKQSDIARLVLEARRLNR